MHKLSEAVSQLLGNPGTPMSGALAQRAKDIGLGPPRRTRVRKNRSRGKKSSKPKGMPPPHVVAASPAFKEYLKANSSAFSTKTAPPFMSFNPQPSLQARAGRATFAAKQNVPTGFELWIAVGCQDTVTMDGNAYHVGGWVDNSAAYRWMGPYISGPTANVLPTIGAMQLVGAGLNFSPNLTGTIPMPPLQNWPISTNASNVASSQRYMPTCWEVYLENETPIGTRGGDFVTVNPGASSLIDPAGTTCSALLKNGSYRESASHEGHLFVPARPVDLGFRHAENAYIPFGAAPNALMSNPSGFIIYRNTTATQQNISIRAAAKYAIAGVSAAAVTTQLDLTPHHAGHYEAASSAVTSGTIHPTLIGMGSLAAHKAVATGKSTLEALGNLMESYGSQVITAGAAKAGFTV